MGASPGDGALADEGPLDARRIATISCCWMTMNQLLHDRDLNPGARCGCGNAASEIAAAAAIGPRCRPLPL
jgi:hypothetical protein